MKKSFKNYVEGIANPEEFSSVVDDLTSGHSEEQVTAELLDFWKETLVAYPDVKENGQLLDKIHHRIALSEPFMDVKKLSLYRNLLRFAAILILALTVSTALLYNPKKEVIQPYASVIDTVTTPYGARTSFKLPDGSDIWLNSGSSVSFSRQFGKSRCVKLKGEAYFKVKKDGRPFTVETSSGKVEVIGTSFDVKAYPQENFETTLVEGVVKVNDKVSRTATLQPGQRSIHSSSSGFTLTNVNTELITSWKDGKLIFVQEPFSNVVR
jgi:transmembrane sensor